MARSHARIATDIWSDDHWRSLTPMAQWMYTTLLSQPKLTLAGALDVKVRSWAALATHVTPSEVEDWLDQLEADEFIAWDRETDELVIRTFVRNDGVLKNRNLGRGMWAAWAAIESSRLRQVVLDNLPPEAFDPKHEPRAAPPQEPPDTPPRNHSSDHGSDTSPDQRPNLPTPATYPCRPAASSPPTSRPPSPVDNHLDRHIAHRGSAITNPAGYRRTQLPLIAAAAAAGDDLEARWPTSVSVPTPGPTRVHSTEADFEFRPDGTVTPRRATA